MCLRKYVVCLSATSVNVQVVEWMKRNTIPKKKDSYFSLTSCPQVLGLARHVAPELKARRFVCNPCFFIIRRNYKDKLKKEASEEAKAMPLPATPSSLGSQGAIHRATTEEHAAEIVSMGGGKAL